MNSTPQLQRRNHWQIIWKSSNQIENKPNTSLNFLLKTNPIVGSHSLIRLNQSISTQLISFVTKCVKTRLKRYTKHNYFCLLAQCCWMPTVESPSWTNVLAIEHRNINCHTFFQVTQPTLYSHDCLYWLSMMWWYTMLVTAIAW